LETTKNSGFFLFIAIGLGYLYRSGFDLTKILSSAQDTSPLGFVLAMSFLPLVGFPIAPCYLFAGTVFPWWQAWAFCSLSLAVNMSVAYPLGRGFLASPIRGFLEGRNKEMPVLTENNQFRVTFVVRAVPGVPYFIQNYLLAVLGVRFGTYLVVSWLIQSLIAAGMTSLPHLALKAGWMVTGVSVGILLLLIVLHRIYIRKNRKETVSG